MKKILEGLCLALFLCLSPASYAASIGGVETQGKGKFSLDLVQEFVFNRDIADKTIEARTSPYTTITVDGVTTHAINDPGGARGILNLSSEMDKAQRSMIKLNYGLLDNLDFFVKFGAADYELKGKGRMGIGDRAPSPEIKLTNVREELTFVFKGERGFAWALGLQGVYPLGKDWLLGTQAQYLRHKNVLRVSGVTRLKGSYKITAGPGAGQTGTWKTEERRISRKWEATAEEWHIAPYVARRLGNFLPYLGVRYSALQLKLDMDGRKEEFHADNNFGVFIGTNYKLNNRFTFNIEGRFVDETAISAAVTFKF